jgi:hypothetical protein
MGKNTGMVFNNEELSKPTFVLSTEAVSLFI